MKAYPYSICCGSGATGLIMIVVGLGEKANGRVRRLLKLSAISSGDDLDLYQVAIRLTVTPVPTIRGYRPWISGELTIILPMSILVTIQVFCFAFY
jgi:hypothetical protein